MQTMRWNLIVFFVGLELLAFGLLAFAYFVLDASILKGNEELIIGAVMATVTLTIGYVGGYASGVMQSLTSPPDPAPTVTEETLKYVVDKMKS